MEIINALGRRKGAVARVYFKQGSGSFVVNGRDYKEYFPQLNIRMSVEEPLAITETASSYDIKVTVRGGGFKGQAEAIRLGLARGLVKINEEYKALLKPKGMLTRDARVVERKKYGKPKARKSFQFSKR